MHTQYEILEPLICLSATGHLFGKGIYFADSFSKSAGYCYNWSHSSSTKFMLICQVSLSISVHANTAASSFSDVQVALGKQQKVAGHLNNSEGLAEGKNSKLAMSAHMPDPVLNITAPSGAQRSCKV